MRTLLHGLLMGGMSDAVKLYTVTIQSRPTYRETVILLIAPDEKGAWYSVSKPGPVASFKLPAGTYNFTARPDSKGPQTFDISQHLVTVKSDMTYTISLRAAPVTPAAPLAIGPVALGAWNRLLIDMRATVVDCPDPSPDQQCALADSGPSVVKSYIGLQTNLQQTTPWTSVGKGSVAEMLQFRVRSVKHCPA